MDLLTVTWRSVAGFVVLLVLMRISGKQQVAQLTVFEFVLAITIGSLAADLSVQTNDPFTSIALGLIIWTTLGLLLSAVSVRSRRWSKILHGEGTILVENGHILERNLRKSPNMTLDDLLMMLRSNGAFELREVEFAVHELDGTLSVLKKSQHRPATPSDLQISTRYEGLPIELIYDGRVVEKNLKGARLDRDWLIERLRTQGVHDLRQVMLAQLYTDGKLYVDRRNDQPVTIDISDYDNQLELV